MPEKTTNAPAAPHDLSNQAEHALIRTESLPKQQ